VVKSYQAPLPLKNAAGGRWPGRNICWGASSLGLGKPGGKRLHVGTFIFAAESGRNSGKTLGKD
jgi:hypothetical protein